MEGGTRLYSRHASVRAVNVASELAVGVLTSVTSALHLRCLSRCLVALHVWPRLHPLL